MTEVEQPSQNGIELTTEEDENNKARPADIEQDMREMERRKRVEAIMGSRLFREELERIVDSQIREGGASGILQQLSDIVGVPTSRVGNVFKSSNCVLPINDIRGVESMGYSKGEKILRCKLAATFRLLDLSGWSKGLGAQITARLKVDQELFLVNPYGLLFHEVTASSLNKVDMQGNVIEQGTTNFGVNKNHFILHSVVHAARPDIRCAIYIGCNPVVAVSSLKVGLLPLTNDSVVLGEISTHQYSGCLADAEEREKLVRNLGPVSKVMLLTNHGALCCGETIEEAFFAAHHIVQACETQLKLLPVGIDNLVMIPEESRKTIYDAARRPPEDIAAAFEKKAAAIAAAAAAAAAASASEDVSTADESQTDNSKDTSHKLLQQPKWRVGGAEFEALMRMLDNAGFRTGYIYRHPLIKSELPKAKNDVEVPPAVSSLGYLLEEEELYRQGIWKKGDWRKGGDRSRWLNSPNVYQKVEVLETGTPDPKKITKWVAEGSPTHSTPVRIEGALQFVPPGTNPKEFKKVQQQIKDNRRADKISAGPQSHILEGVTWDEANRIKDATVSSAGDHVVLMGAASKGIIQRGFQHNATVYKAPYAKNPFDNVTDDELNEYKRTVERKKNIHGEYTDTDFSESEALSSLQTSGAQQQNSSKTAVVSQSETEDASEHQVMRIETKQAPVPSQPEVVLSDATLDFLNGERQHTATNKNLPSPRAQESSSTNTTNNTPVAIIKVDQSEQTDDQETDQILNTDSTSDGSYHQKFFNPMLADKFLMQNIYFRDLLQQNTHFQQSCTDAQYWMFPIDFEIISPEVFPLEDYSSECFTPRICYPVVQSDIQSLANSTIYNVPYSKTSSEFPTAHSSKVVDIDFKPYRTLSHFGFNCPRHQTPPEHYHIPVSPSKYVPLKKSLSYNEVFSSPRYVDLCDICFDKVLRLRPELFYPKTSRTDNQDDHNLRKSFVKVQDNDEDKSDDEDDGDNFDLLDAVKNWLDNEQLNDSRVLEPVMEVDEEDQGSPPNTPLVDYNSNVIGVSESSTFLDKITRMNYSEESTNVGFQPWKTVTSDITMENEDKVGDLANEISCLTLQTSPENDKEVLLSAEQPFSDDRTADVTSSTECGSDLSQTSTRKLMSREERNKRKQEFTELWEDHIEYFTPKQFSDSDSGSEIERNKSEIFYGESRLSSMSLADVPSISTDSVSATYRIGSSSQTDQVVHATSSTDFYSFAETEPLASDSELNSMERMIIEKIEENHLKDQEQIFEDIENTIRSKMTPSKLERIVQHQRTEMNPTVLSSTPEAMSVQESESFYSLNVSEVEKKDNESSTGSRQNRSRSLTCGSGNRKRRLRHVPTFRDLSRVDQDQSPLPSTVSSSTDNSPPERRTREITVPNRPSKCPKHTMSADCMDCQLSRKRVKRNFVAENIRNAARPRRRYNIAALLSSNSFGNSSSTPCLSPNNKTGKTTPPVYSFQTNSSGSPRFWVTLSPRNKDVAPTLKLKDKKNGAQKQLGECEDEREFGKIGRDLEIEIKPSLDQKQDTLNSKNIPLNPIIKTKKLSVHKSGEEKEVRFECDQDLEQPKESKTDGDFDIKMESSNSEVEKQIDSLGQEIDALKPRLDKYKKTIDEYGEQIAKVSQSMDGVVEAQNEIEDSRQKLREDIILNQYMERVSCDVQTFSISEADD